ncbi:hypothetical protein CDAR_415631 [Caerostris darwini]|uniref:Uncharacterized protein n=1 Tax=Caerostris darwini TaxID=1538125 RepID=A0AAV4Q558_9ARAC|nr:hypothetical protein CDAR_415631 [Caerostris darwini]
MYKYLLPRIQNSTLEFLFQEFCYNLESVFPFFSQVTSRGSMICDYASKRVPMTRVHSLEEKFKEKKNLKERAKSLKRKSVVSLHDVTLRKRILWSLWSSIKLNSHQLFKRKPV